MEATTLSFIGSPWFTGLAIAAAGCAAGFTNTLAGGGSLIALPALVLLGGLGESTANGTLRVAILVQTAVAVLRYHRAGSLDPRRALRLALPAAAGALIGAWLATLAGDALLRKVLVGVLLLATAWLALDRRASQAARPAPPWVVALALFGAGLYGGFVQAGVGFLLLLALTRGAGLDLVGANVLKVAIVLVYTPLALLTFAASGQVDAALGAALATGQAAGAWLAAGVTLSASGLTWTRRVLIVAVIALTARLALA